MKITEGASGPTGSGALTLLPHAPTRPVDELRVGPGALSVAAVTSALAGLGIAAVATAEFGYAAWGATGGDRFLVAALRDAITTDPGSWSGGQLENLLYFTPANASPVLARLRSLDADESAVAQACAVLGDDVPLETCSAVAGLDVARAMDVVERLNHRDVIVGMHRISAAQSLIRSALLAQLSATARSRLHARAACILRDQGAAAVEVAHHLIETVHVDEPWTVGVLVEAAQDAAAAGALVAAARMLERVLESAPPPHVKALVLTELGRVETASGQAGSVQHLRQAVDILADPVDQARALHALGLTLCSSARYDEAAEVLQRGENLAAGQDTELSLALEAAYFGLAHYLPSVQGEADARMEQFLAGLDDRELTTSERVILANAALRRAVNADHPPAETVQLAERALCGQPRGGGLDEQSSEDLIACCAAETFLICGEVQRAQQVADVAVAEARQRGAAMAVAAASQTRAMVGLARGRLDEATRDAQTAVDGIEHGWRAGMPAAHAALAQCLVQRGRLDSAEEALAGAARWFDPAAGGSQRTGPEIGLARYHAARASLLLASGDWAAALDELQIVGRSLDALGRATALDIPWRSLSAIAELNLGHPNVATSLVVAELKLARRFGAPGPVGRALRVSALIDGSLTDLRQAAELLDAAGLDVELAQARLDLGRLLLSAGDVATGREQLRLALDGAHRCGASLLEEAARADLTAAGARPRRSACSGVHALTPNELRIARLAAQGRSNRDIAESLFLSKNTVDWHMRNAFAKLGVRSRVALSDVLSA